MYFLIFLISKVSKEEEICAILQIRSFIGIILKKSLPVSV